tara:strand:+ start:765 stop:1181 length:417 start_codon:yes stop_codon:yes gene_type:complete
MKLPKNGVAKEIRSYSGALLIFLFIVALVIVFIQYPVLESNKEVVMMLVGTLSASLAMVISTITGSKPDDINELKATIEKRDSQINILIESKDRLEEMVINLQREMLQNQDNMMDKIILKAAMEFDDNKQHTSNKEKK